MDLPNSNAARDVAYHLHGYTNMVRHAAQGPLVIGRGKGCRVMDEEGRDYIEGMAGLWCTALGWGEERLAEVAARQMRELAFYHTFTGKSHPAVIALAEALIQRAPVPMGKVFFANSGSEANDTALKIVWYVNNALGRSAKKKIIGRTRGYHGVTIGAGSLTALPVNQNGFDPIPIPGMLQTQCPHFWKFGQDGESEEQFASRCAEMLDAQITAEGPDTVAAFIAEPVMGAGGVIVPPATYFDKIQAVLKKHDVLLIADEVICAFGRTGKRWGSETYDMSPDIVTCAKALSSGYLPISAVLVSHELCNVLARQSDTLGVFGHGFTYGGHPVSAAVALETLKIYDERDILAHVRAVGPVLQDGLRRFADHPLVGEVRGVGLIGAVELVADRATKRPFDPKLAVGPGLVARAQAEGVILRAMGDAVAFSPPLIIDQGEIEEMLRRFGRALDQTLAWAQAEKLV